MSTDVPVAHFVAHELGLPMTDALALPDAVNLAISRRLNRDKRLIAEAAELLEDGHGMAEADVTSVERFHDAHLSWRKSAGVGPSRHEW